MSYMTEVNEWKKAARWPWSHFIVAVDREPWNGVVWAKAACGPDVSWDKLGPEPTGIDTVDRCARCVKRMGAES